MTRTWLLGKAANVANPSNFASYYTAETTASAFYVLVTIFPSNLLWWQHPHTFDFRRPPPFFFAAVADLQTGAY